MLDNSIMCSGRLCVHSTNIGVASLMGAHVYRGNGPGGTVWGVCAIRVGPRRVAILSTVGRVKENGIKKGGKEGEKERK